METSYEAMVGEEERADRENAAEEDEAESDSEDSEDSEEEDSEDSEDSAFVARKKRRLGSGW